MLSKHSPTFLPGSHRREDCRHREFFHQKSEAVSHEADEFHASRWSRYRQDDDRVCDRRRIRQAGIFVGDQLIEAGRAELVGQYEGQTVARTRNFLVSNLDRGVILIDEAYAITPWQNGKPEGYGSEAATAMVEFMSRYAGLYCIIVAGYETQMVRYFLPTNEGLSRRFPNKYVLNDMSVTELIEVFKRALLRSQGLRVPDGGNVRLESSDYFDADAWRYLHNLIEICTSGTTECTEEYDAATRKTYYNVPSFASFRIPVHGIPKSGGVHDQSRRRGHYGFDGNDPVRSGAGPQNEKTIP